MAIAFDNSNISAANVGTSYSVSFTTSGTNRLLVMSFNYNANAANPITDITYAGTAMTLQGYAQNSRGGNASAGVYYLLNPASGSNTFSVTASAGIDTVILVSYTGVKQSGFPDATGTGSPADNAAATSISASITPVASNVWGVLTGTFGSGGETNGTNATIVKVTAGRNCYADTNGALTGTFTMNMTFNNSVQDVNYFSFAPAAATAVSMPTLPLMGIG